MTIEEPEEFQLDGDEFGEATAVRAWVEPNALTVRMPALSLRKGADTAAGKPAAKPAAKAAAKAAAKIPA